MQDNFMGSILSLQKCFYIWYPGAPECQKTWRGQVASDVKTKRVGGGARPKVFDRSVNPIWIIGGRLCPPIITRLWKAFCFKNCSDLSLFEWIVLVIENMFCKFSAFSLEFQMFFSITRTIFSHSGSEQFWKLNTKMYLPKEWWGQIPVSM